MFPLRVSPPSTHTCSLEAPLRARPFCNPGHSSHLGWSGSGEEGGGESWKSKMGASGSVPPAWGRLEEVTGPPPLGTHLASVRGSDTFRMYLSLACLGPVDRSYTRHAQLGNTRRFPSGWLPPHYLSALAAHLWPVRRPVTGSPSLPLLSLRPQGVWEPPRSQGFLQENEGGSVPVGGHSLDLVPLQVLYFHGGMPVFNTVHG